MTTFDEALTAARTSLGKAGAESPGLDARLLLAAASRLDMAELIARGNVSLPALAHAVFDDHMKRRLKGEPVARIVGEKEFWGLPLAVGPAVLVPRPDTETLVEVVLAETRRRFADNGVGNVTICDLGTGTGAILIALLSALSDAHGTATDISPEALAMARLNAERHRVAERIDFAQADFATGPRGPFHVVVANPPYIRSDAIDELGAEVRGYDPRLALDGGPDGLAAYRSILRRIDSLLVEGGLLGFEVGYDQGESVAALCREKGLGDVCMHSDLTGTGRVVTAFRTMSGASAAAAKKALGKVERSR
jgi:release factor glutamine methyltransferase